MSDGISLTSVAMLKVNSDVQGQDYIDYFLPFVCYVLDRYQVDPVTRETTQEHLRQEFGLVVPLHATEWMLRRLSKKGFLNRHDHIYTIQKPLPIPDIEKRRQKARLKLEGLLSGVISFSKAQFDVVLSEDEAIAGLTGYLSEFSISFLGLSGGNGGVLPAVPSEKKVLFILNRFIEHVRSGNSELFGSLVLLVKGQLLANALLCPDLDSLPRTFRSVTFYLDTPLVVRLTGLEGEVARQAATELLELVKRLQGRLAIFEHTEEEVYRVIEGAEHHLDKASAKGRIVEAARRSGKTPSDLALARARLPELLQSHNISRVSTPAYSRVFNIDEKALRDVIEDEMHYNNPRAQDYDINSIRSIYALRRGAQPRRLEDSSAVMVTPNAALARLAFEFGKAHESSREVSTVIADFSLANLAWLKAPVGAPELPEIEVLANCYAALNPSDALWEKYLREVEKLEKDGQLTASEHQALRYSIRARDELMNLTLGAEEDLSERTVSQILAKVKEDFVKETDDAFSQKLGREREQAAKLDSERLAVIEDQKRQLLKEHSEAASLHESNERVRAKCYWLSRTISNVASWIIVLCGLAMRLGSCAHSWLERSSLPLSLKLLFLY